MKQNVLSILTGSFAALIERGAFQSILEFVLISIMGGLLGALGGWIFKKIVNYFKK